MILRHPTAVRRGLRLVFVSVAAASLLPTATGQAPSIHLVALKGQIAPGFPAGATFSDMQGSRIDDLGRTAFYGLATGAGLNGFNDQALYQEGPTGLVMLVREGDLAPGTAGARFWKLAEGIANPPGLGLNAQAELAFTTRLVGGDVCDCDFNGVIDNDSAMYRQVEGGLQLLARADSHVPGQPPGLLFDTIIGHPLIAENGELVSFFVVKGTGVTPFNGTAIMGAAEGEELSLLVRQGDPLPGFPAGTKISELTRPCLSPDGNFSFTTRLAGPGITTTNDDAIVSWIDGVLSVVAREGQVLPNGDVLGNPSVLGVFFNSSLRGGEILAASALLADGSAVLRQMGGGLEVLARSGDAAPGLPLGTKFGNFGDFVSNGPLQLGEDGRTVFMARLNTLPPTNESLWMAEPDGSLLLVARGGDAAPGAAPGVTFGNGTGGFVQIFGSTALDASGRVAFTAHLQGPGITQFTSGFYVADPDGSLQAVAQPGDVIDVAGDGSDLRTVLGAGFNKDGSGLEEYNGPVFNGAGQLVFRLSFTDGSHGIFEADLDGAFTDLGGGLAGVAGVPQLQGTGALQAATPGSLELSQAAPSAPGLLFLSLGSSPVPFKGGLLLAFPPAAQIPVATTGAGGFTLGFVTPAGLPSALELTLQVALQDGVAVKGVALSNGLGATTP